MLEIAGGIVLGFIAICLLPYVISALFYLLGIAIPIGLIWLIVANWEAIVPYIMLLIICVIGFLAVSGSMEGISKYFDKRKENNK